MTDSNEGLLASDEPALKYKIHTQILGSPADSLELVGQREEIRGSARVVTLLSERDANAGIPRHPYLKWTRAHWDMAALDLLEKRRLAEGGFPAAAKHHIGPERARTGRLKVTLVVTCALQPNPFATAEAPAVLTAADRARA